MPALGAIGGGATGGGAAQSAPSAVQATAGADTPLTARGLLEPPAEAVLSSGIAGRIEALPRRAGERFDQGDLLARFDCALYEARLAAAEAGVLKARRQLANDRQLADLASIGRLEVGLAEAELARAEAQAGVTAVLVERCRLTAPFDGRVVEWRAEPHETVAEGAPILEVVATGPPEVALIVPSRWLPRLGVGQPFTFAVDETGTRHDGTLLRLGARIDPASQTVRVIGRLEGAGPDLVPGMSGTARFATQPGG
ncbi:MAG: efflux RND transporter periplasmic adaptor subunit [Azospirillaceae bacterium]